MNSMIRYVVTGAIVLAAIAVGVHRWRVYLENPWTRDGQVQAQVIEIAPRVSGPIVALPIRDNQFVRAGDVLFEIDPRTYQVSLDQARAQLDQTERKRRGAGQTGRFRQGRCARCRARRLNRRGASSRRSIRRPPGTRPNTSGSRNCCPKKATSQKALERAQAVYEVSVEERKVGEGALLQAEANLQKAQAALAEAQARLGAVGASNPQLRLALATIRQAELNLEFTTVRAPADGYVTHLRLRIGSHAVANQPTLALVDTATYWVDAYVKETRIAGIKSGDQAVVTLMTYPDRPLKGVVDSLGWGISQQDGSTAANLLPRVSATFEWIRLAQRIPVRIRLLDVPKDVQLRVGTTCSVLIAKQSAAGRQDGRPAPQQ